MIDFSGIICILSASSLTVKGGRNVDNPEKWVELASPGPLEEVAKLKTFLEKVIKGQPKAIGSVCKMYEYDLTLRWLEEKQGPLGTFMFLGPSGVGKTELSRMLSLYFMGSVEAMIKVDCSAFNQPHMIHALIGAPHGFIGYNDKPTLSMATIMSRLKKKPLKPPTNSPTMDLTEEKKAPIIRSIENLNLRLANLKYEFKARVSFIRGIRDYHYLLHNSGVADLFKDEETRSLVIEMLHPDSVDILDSSLANPTEDAAILLGLSSELKQIYRDHKETEIRIENLRRELFAINKKMIKDQNVGSNPKEERRTDKEPSPRLVLLFDEIEKGNQALHNLLLQIMEDGRLTLANGDITDLSNAFIVMTSNVGSSAISGLLKDKRMGFRADKKTRGFNEGDGSFEDLESRILQVAETEMEKTFNSAFRGRIDEISVFRPLTRKDFYDILDLHIDVFSQSLGILDLKLTVDQEAKDIIIAQSLHRPEVGARLLEHKFKSLVKIPLGHRLTGKRNFKGIIRVSTDDNNKIKFLI